MEELLAYHLVFTTHNSRTSKRIKRYVVKLGPPRLLSLEEELILTKIMGEIILDNKYRCVAVNVCRDHVHLVLVCKSQNLTKIVQKLKAMSSRLFNRSEGVSKELTALHKGHLWSQKFYFGTFDDLTLATLSNIAGEVYQSSHLDNTLKYIKFNRVKHRLQKSDAMEEMIDGFVMSCEEAFSGGVMTRPMGHDPLGES